MEGFSVQEYKVGTLKDIVVLKAAGYIDTNTSPELQRTMSRVIDDGWAQLIVDMAAVQYVSSAGWGVFVGEIRRLQEQGGDLKITQMSPEVYEVFEMLEFNRIITSYDNLEEAISDFDFCRGVLVPQNGSVYASEKRPTPQESPAPRYESALPHLDSVVAEQPAPAQPPTPAPTPKPHRIDQVDDKKLPLNEKIKKIVLENPMLGLFSIKKMLFSPRFGYIQISLWVLRSTLKRLNLHTKSKRFRYYRSR